MSTTSWKLNHVTEHYLKQVRGGIPYGADQTKMMLQVINHFQSEPVVNARIKLTLFDR
ncbi:Uncharacterised protein [Niallia circulans]|nr:Uncharacterised protein [Niallia circulans]